MREREDFLAATAHDLTTPLVGLRLCIGRSDDDAKALVERLLIIVSNIKDFLKLGGRRAPNITNVDLLASVREAYTVFAADFRDLFDGKDVEIISLGAVYARADSVMLMQILWNLFGNDLKYAAPYGKVTVKIRRQGAFAFVDFIDNGQGMTKHEMKCAFDRYYRASTVLKSGKGGFGIGLCTAREFARAMGGELSVSPNFPRGCVFTLRLPSVIVKRCS
jgi:signal transduction histidine kinase